MNVLEAAMEAVERGDREAARTYALVTIAESTAKIAELLGAADDLPVLGAISRDLSELTQYVGRR